MSMTASSRPVIFGEVLYDCFPDGQSVLGGAPFNVAWHLQAFGLAPLFISRIGDDPLGRKIRQAMLEWDMSTTGLQLDSAHPTGTVSIAIDENGHSFEILAEQAYDFIDAECLPPTPNAPLLYHGSLAARGRISHSALQQLRQQGWPVFVDVNLRAPWWQSDSVLALVKGATWLKLNDEELDALIEGDGDLTSKAKQMLEEYRLSSIFVTRGAAGALACTVGGEVFEVAPHGNLPIVDTVGAGDAFASVLLLGLIQGWSQATLLERAQQFASAIVTRRGATVQDRAFYRPFIEEWGLS